MCTPLTSRGLLTFALYMEIIFVNSIIKFEQFKYSQNENASRVSFYSKSNLFDEYIIFQLP